MVTLTRTGGHTVGVNPAQVSHVNERGGDNPCVVVMSNGVDFEVEESFEDLLMALQG
jgi:uncharacterized protein YlzI (FlbEa/FlbD family)